MSIVVKLFKGNMDDEWQCSCPSCGESVYVDLKNDFYQTLNNGDEEYAVRCSKCGQVFYTAKSYD
jgi:uncharacterized Zn finger protein